MNQLERVLDQIISCLLGPLHLRTYWQPAVALFFVFDRAWRNARSLRIHPGGHS
jgi:hypothetical protein